MRIYRTSLANTLDAFNDAQFHGRKLSAADKKELALWLAGRQGLQGAYAQGTMFAPTARDFKNGFRTFTGERITSGAATSNQLGEETLRALLTLNVKAKPVRLALDAALTGKNSHMQYPGRPQGFHCCGSCSVALWRRWMVSGEEERELASGLRLLKKYRDGNGRYRRFPFWYTALALSEVTHKAALPEIRYLAPVLTRVLKRKPGPDKYAKRRLTVAERCLAKV